MKVVFAGGGTGGHFYPLIAVAEEIRNIAREQRLIMPKLYYVAPTAFDPEALFENEIVHIPCAAGKWRRYFSFQNYLDVFVTIGGYFSALMTLYSLYPDVVFSKGGYASVPVTLAAATLGIPVFIHESDAKPGRANLLAAGFAKRIAVAFDSAAAFFPPKTRAKVARTGIPIRTALMHPEPEGAREELRLDTTAPTILFLGGSSGAKRVNDAVIAALPELATFANVIHQTGKEHFDGVSALAKLVLEKNPELVSRYHPFPYLSALSMRRASGAADLVVSRAGMSTVAEVALWGKPSILIPIPEEVSHDQRMNAYAYARSGAASVIEESNLTPHLLVSEAKRILSDQTLRAAMAAAGTAFANKDAGRIIAEEIVTIGLSHEPDAAPAA